MICYDCTEGIAELTRQRDSARAWAVELENDCAEKDARIKTARHLVRALTNPLGPLGMDEGIALIDALADPS